MADLRRLETTDTIHQCVQVTLLSMHRHRLKIMPVAPSQTMPQGGFVEAWGYDRSKGGVKIIGHKKITSIPLSLTHVYIY